MSLKFAANLNFLFADLTENLCERIKFAYQHGFRAVEIPFPQTAELRSSIVQLLQTLDIKVSLINIALGEQHLAFGATSVPGAEETFKTQLEETVNFAKNVNCQKIHLMAGLQQQQHSFEQHLKTYRENLIFAADYLKQKQLIGVIEPINKYALPNYFLNDYNVAARILREIQSEHLKLMLDIFHLQHIQGNVKNSFDEMKDIIGHIQIAQAPHRHEPDVAGELDFNYIFDLIKCFGYEDFIGCEYRPKTNTVEGLKWLKTLNV